MTLDEETPYSETERPDDEMARLTRELEEEKARADRNLANWQRTQADFINLKRRSAEEKEEIIRTATGSLMLSLLPILDDLERALAAIPPDIERQPWMEGIRQIERKLKAALERHGLAPIKAAGEPFDPNYHEAVKHEKGKEGIIITELEKGYLLHDRLLRPSKIICGSGEEAQKEE